VSSAASRFQKAHYETKPHLFLFHNASKNHKEVRTLYFEIMAAAVL